jgi:hypothetical protein
MVEKQMWIVVEVGAMQPAMPGLPVVLDGIVEAGCV